MPLSNILVENIRKARKQKQFSQEYMAVKLGISQPAYSDIENERVRFPIEKIERFAEILECPTHTLFDGILQNDIKEQEGKINPLEQLILFEDIQFIKKLHEEVIRSKDELIQNLKNQLATKR
ncbi:MAG: helix-turn-helix transcriptional regulator [Bacteroidota bacterium]